uniref:Serpin domain-containing protein n=1 Tax=Graphocephala atropunctata TaxID=36148 RepID=A0A1B6LMV2_9HEMI
MSGLRCSTVLLLVLCVTGIYCDHYDEDCAREKRRREALQARHNLFDADLLEEISKSKPDNFVVSPVGIKTLLALILEGANGSTLKELQNLLRLPDKIADARNKLGELQSALQKSGYSRVIVDSVAQVFVSEALVTNSTYAKTIKDYYNAEVSPQNFGQPEATTHYINSWINTRTRGLIPTLLSEGFIDPRTYSILVSAVYFDGKWKNAFKRRDTRDGCFYSGPNMACQTTPMMTKIEELQYNFDITLDAHVLQIPYQDERFFMVIVLPSKKDGIKQLSVDSSRLLFPLLIQRMVSYEVNLTMPRFTMEFETELIATLKEIGLTEVFSNSAKLPYMFNDKQGKIDAMIHKAKIEVNEKGTKGAAGSAASVIPLMQSVNRITLELNHPFYYFVCEANTNAVLFMGRLSSVEGAVKGEEADQESNLMTLQNSRRPVANAPTHSGYKPSSHGAYNHPYTAQPQPSTSTRRMMMTQTGF